MARPQINDPTFNPLKDPKLGAGVDVVANSVMAEMRIGHWTFPVMIAVKDMPAGAHGGLGPHEPASNRNFLEVHTASWHDREAVCA